MLLPVLSGSLIGLFLPAIAARFGKILPADPGTVLLTLFHRPRFPKGITRSHVQTFFQKWQKLVGISCIWSVIMTGLFTLIWLGTAPQIHIFGAIFVSIVCCCMIVDSLYFLLPDFFTIPLLILGFAASLSGSVLTPFDSVCGATFGYLLATISVLILGKKQAELGGGDVKMMTAIGAWLGISGLNFTLLLSFFLFAVPAALNARRHGAYGPALGLAALTTFFMIYGL